MDIVVWLRSLGLGKYEAAFRENEIDETVLPNLTAEDLKRSLASQRWATAASCSMPSPLCVADASAHSGLPLTRDYVQVHPAPPLEDRAERRQVTVMFSDLGGLNGTLGPHGP